MRFIIIILLTALLVGCGLKIHGEAKVKHTIDQEFCDEIKDPGKRMECILAFIDILKRKKPD